MGVSNWFGFATGSTTNSELPEIFPIGIAQNDFVKTDVINIFSKILIDTLERVHGLNDDLQSLLWDNCVKSNSPDGLITLLAKAMADKMDLFLVYEKAVKVLRTATSTETEQIKADYLEGGESAIGVFISFKNFTRSDMVKLYSVLEYCTVNALNKAMNLSKTIQIKMNDMRATVSLSDSADVKAQGVNVATALSKGRDILVDAKDIIESATPDLTAVKESIMFINQKRSFYLGMPESYINGEQTGGLGTTGENDTKAIERGLKNYFESIVKPVLDAIFGIKVTYKSQDFRQIAGSMEVVKTFSLVDEELISLENKTLIVNRLLDLPEDAKGDGPDPVVPTVVVDPNKVVRPPAVKP